MSASVSSWASPRRLGPLAADLRSGTLDVHALVDDVCDRVDATEPHLQAYVVEASRRDRMHAEAEAVLASWPDPAKRPRLFGIPVGVKDIVRVDGLETRAGSGVPPDVLAGPQATLVDRLRAAGALVSGKTVTAEFASAAPGPTRNPYDLSRTPGGSSSGSAAAVAAGSAVLATGTQTIGSMVRPASFCGIVGWKATHGRVPIDGVIPHSPSLDTLGLFAADVEGVSVAAAAVCDSWDTSQVPADRPRAGIPTGRYLDEADTEALAVFADQCGALRAAGFDITDVDVITDLDDLLTHNWIVNRYELARTHDDWYDAHRSGYRAITAEAIDYGRTIGRSQYEASLEHMRELRVGFAGRLETAGVDLLVAPGAVGPAPHGIDTTGDPAMALPWTYAGLPAVSLPGARTTDGMPLGLQLVGPAGSDEALLATASSWEPHLRWSGAEDH